MDKSPLLLETRIQQKQQELESYKQIKELTSALAVSLSKLEEKLATLTDGTEAVSVVLSNWNHIVKASSLASMGLFKFSEQDYENIDNPPLPETLVRFRLNEETTSSDVENVTPQSQPPSQPQS
ncbi:BA75_03509T0 [Komagataella pastoris]|uniref:DASH complex subunit DAD2 n=1 Tax=Komagataella pastoris TaxID=4922 RepID=A0A1B2JEW8_PICPA|nr:BA75_03509T0 [Komagataella pastoris]